MVRGPVIGSEHAGARRAARRVARRTRITGRALGEPVGALAFPGIGLGFLLATGLLGSAALGLFASLAADGTPPPLTYGLGALETTGAVLAVAGLRTLRDAPAR